MPNVFLASDHHFGHEKCVSTFVRKDGSPLRAFKDADHMNEEIIRRHNSVVTSSDLVYFLGDVTANKKHLHHASRLNGRKRLVKGNHDDAKTPLYMEHFEEIYGVKELKDMILSHVPLHPDHVGRFGRNVHGHLHDKYVNSVNFLCVSLEHTNYYPLSLDEVRKRFIMNQKNFDKTGFVIDFSESFSI